MARPPRLPESKYVGLITVSFTITTHRRVIAIADPATADQVVAQLLQCADRFDVELTAYCAMPDHVHVVATGKSPSANSRTMIVRWKQLTGYWYKQKTGSFLWEKGIWDRVLKPEDDVRRVALYVLENPLRAKLVTHAADYQWSGSQRWRITDLCPRHPEGAASAAPKNRSCAAEAAHPGEGKRRG